MTHHSSDVFISYAREDRDHAAHLAESLAAHGWSVWWDPLIRTGQSFDRSIEQALKGSRCAVVLWSRHAVDSDWVRAEAGYAKDNGKLIPAFIEDGVEPPLQFRHMHAVSLGAFDGDRASEGLRQLIADIEAFLAPSVPELSPDVVTREAAVGADRAGVTPPSPAQAADADPGKSLHAVSARPGAHRRLALLLGAVAVAAASSQQGQMLVSGLAREHGGSYQSLWLLVAALSPLVLVPWMAWAARRATSRVLLAAMLLLVGVVALFFLTFRATSPAIAIASSGIGTGLMMAVLLLALDLTYREAAAPRRGLRVGLLLAVSSVGASLSARRVALDGGGAGAGGSLVAGAAVAAVLAVLVLRAAWPMRPHAGPAAKSSAAQREAVWRVGLAALLVALVFHAIGGAFTMHVVEQGGSNLDLGVSFLGASLAGPAGAIAAGWLCDRLGPWRPGAAAVTALALLAWPMFVASPAIALSAYPLAVMVMMAWTATLYVHVCSRAVAGASLWPIALTLFAASLGGSAGAFAQGSLMGAFNVFPAVPLLALLALIAVPLMRGPMRSIG